jgi:alkanesulfonate monooxygenase SsuD/methylene tetrahydromethanopterin reductase-like flavin-dependent oxidoreductase (luciferase family)
MQGDLDKRMDRIRPPAAIGIIFHPKFPSNSLAEYALKAEAAGFDELWLWDDCFLPGAFTSATIALSSTQKIKVGIGLLPVPAYNPLFAAMEITTLTTTFPGRFLPGFGHGVGSWMKQIGSAPKSPLKAMTETVSSVRRLLHGDKVTFHGDWVNLDEVQMTVTPSAVPPLYIGAIREKSLALAGREADGTLLTGMSSPAYIKWALPHIRAGMAESGRTLNRVTVYLDCKVSENGESARKAARRSLAERMPWDTAQLAATGIQAEVEAFMQKYQTVEERTAAVPDAWLDEFSACGTPAQVKASVRRWVEAGADTVVLQPLWGDPDCLDEYIRLLSPIGELVK